MIRGDAAQVYRMAGDFAQFGGRSLPAVRGAMGVIGTAFAEEWANNARETSGGHGKWYPDSISSELTFSVRSVTVETGPDRSRRQGKMGPGFEFGSENQPPHLDGLRALDGIQDRAEQIIDTAMGLAFP